VLRDVFGLRVQIGERASKPLNAHAVSSVSPFVELPRRWQCRPYRPRQGPFLFRRFAIHSALQIPGSLALRQKNDCGPSLSTNGLVASLAWSRDEGENRRFSHSVYIIYQMYTGLTPTRAFD